MTCRSSRIDVATRRLLSAIAATREGRISAMALARQRGRAQPLIDAGLLRRHGSTMVMVAEDDLDDALSVIQFHPITDAPGKLGNTAWQNEDDSAARLVFALDLVAVAKRVLSRIDCTLNTDPVRHLDGAVLEFGTAWLPGRSSRVEIWVARGLAVPVRRAAFSDLVARRPAQGLRLVIMLGPTDPHRPHSFKGHEFIDLEDVVDHEDGLAVNPGILASRLLTGPATADKVWVSGDGAVLLVHGERFEFKGPKQKAAVRMLAEAVNSGENRLSVDAVLVEADCGPTVRRLSELFKDHPAWKRVIFERGASCWIEA